MKFSVILAAIIGAVAISAQTTRPDLDGLPTCVVTCGNNIHDQILNGTYSPGTGCTEVACACKDPKFSKAVSDCSSQNCGGHGDAGSIPKGYAWGEKLCSDNGAPITIIPPAAAGSTGAPSGVAGTATTASTLVPPTAISTGSFTSTITSGSIVSTVVGVTTIFATNGIPVSDGSSVVTSPLVATVTSGSSTFTTTTGSTTLTTTASGSPSSSDGLGNGSGSSSSSSSSSGLGAQATAAPVAGLLAAAGLVAAFL